MKYLIKIICVLLCAVMLLASCGDRDNNKNPSETTGGAGDVPDTGAEKYTASEGLLVYFIYASAYDFTEQELTEHNFDEKLSLKEQKYDETRTWYDVLVENGISKLKNLLAYCNAAAADGVAIDAADAATIENTLVGQRTQAAINSITLDQQLANYYGNDYVTEAVLKQLYELQCISEKYADILEARFTESISDSMIDEQIKKAGLTDTTTTRNLGIIVIAVDDSDSDVNNAKAEAEELLASLKSDGAITREEFEASAEEKSADSDVFYNNVAKGDMIAVIDDWLWGDASRKVGDAGVIVTDYGANILLYESDGETVSRATAKVTLIDQMFEKYIGEAEAKYKSGITDEMVSGLKLDF